jgi:hypothetical protein
LEEAAMKRMLAAVVLVPTLFLIPSLVLAARAQVVLDQTLTGYSKVPGAATVNYSLHLTNVGEAPITELTLTLVPQPPAGTKKVTLNLDYLAPHDGIFIPVQLVTPTLLDQEKFSRMPLFWQGKYLDAGGKAVEIPVVSKPGGAR